MHAQFESIHPFVDGNGRVGRLLITMFLLERQRLYAPLLYLSAFIEAHRRDYYELLQRVRTHGAWNEWILFFLAGIAEVARDAIKQASALLELRDKLRSDSKSDPYLLTLIDELFVNPYITRQRAAVAIGRTYPTATKQLQVLVDRNVLRETSGRKWGQVFVAQPILDVLAQASTFRRG